MQISLRSQMVAGVAALGATAVAITPIVQPDLLPSTQRVAAAFELAAFRNPITAIGSVIQDINTDIFNNAATNYYIPQQAADFPFILDFAPGYEGIIPDAVGNLSFGALASVVQNLSGYAWAGIRSAGVVGAGVAAAAFNAPFALVTAAGQFIGGDPAGALETLVTEIIGPLQQGVQGALEGVGYIVDNLIYNVQYMLTSAVPVTLSNVINQVVAAGSYVLQKAIATVGAIVGNISAGNLEGAWNAAVDGFLGRQGTLGQIEQLTIGAGILEPYTPTNPDDGGPGELIVVPSMRTVIVDAQLAIGEGIFNPNFEPSPGPLAAVKAPAARAAAAEVAPAAEPAATESAVAAEAQDATPVVENAAGARAAAEASGSAVEAPAPVSAAAETAPSAGDAPAAKAAEKPVKQRVSRKAAKAAADN